MTSVSIAYYTLFFFLSVHCYLALQTNIFLTESLSFNLELSSELGRTLTSLTLTFIRTTISLIFTKHIYNRPITANRGACRYVVNVSAMEGKFYRNKTPFHPHTNMVCACWVRLGDFSKTDNRNLGSGTANVLKALAHTLSTYVTITTGQSCTKHDDTNLRP